MEPAVAVNVALLEPEATKTVDGTVSVGVLLDSATLAPVVPAGWDSVTVHVVNAPDARVPGVHDTKLSVGVPPVPETVATNATGSSPFTAPMTCVVEPAAPGP